MSVVVLASAKGSPGTTLTGLGLSWAWPGDVVLVDADPAGGDLALRCRDAAGAPLDPDLGLLTLGAAARRGAEGTSLQEHLQATSLGFPVLAGAPAPEQLGGIAGVWGQLPGVLADHAARHAADVLVDVGRVVPGGATQPLLLAADAVVFVVRPDIEGVAQLRARLRGLAPALRLDQRGARPVDVLVTTSYRDRTVVDDLQRLLDAEGLATRVRGIVARDDKGAAVLTAQRAGDPRRTLLGRSARALADDLVADLSAGTAVDAAPGSDRARPAAGVV